MLYMCFIKTLLFLQILQHILAKSCHKELKLNWTVSISDSPVVSSPLLAKLGKNDKYDLIVTTLDGSLSVIDLSTGQEGLQWPVYFPDESFYSGPLLYDINHDGSEDILLTTSSGKVMFVSQNGTVLMPYTTQLPVLLVKRNWYALNLEDTKHSEYDLSPEKNTRIVTMDEYNKHCNTKFKSFVMVDTHILSTPVIGDFSGNGVNSDLIIPVNYYFDTDVKLDDQRLINLAFDKSDVDYYHVSGIIVLDLQTRQVTFNTTFELTMKSSSLPSYLLSSPTVVDFDGNYSSEEVIIGSMSGKIHTLNKDGKSDWSFHLSDSIVGQIAVGDVNHDRNLEVIIVDSSANVMCYNSGKLAWEASVSGTVTSGAQIYDINNDGKLEIIIATNDGYVWVLDGETGQALQDWPVYLGNNEIHSQVLFHNEPNGLVSMYVMSGGNLNTISGSEHCLDVIPTDEISYTPLVYDPGTKAFIVTTSDGAVMSFFDLQTNNNDIQDEFRIKFTEATNELCAILTSTFDVEFEIFGSQLMEKQSLQFRVIISYSTETGVTHYINKYYQPGVYSVTLQSPKVPKHTYILIELCDRFKQCREDRIFISFHYQTKEKLVLYAVLPLLIMAILLLLLHGYPEGDLLPMWSNYS